MLFTWLHLKCNSTCIIQGTRLKRQFLCIKCKKKKQNRQAGTSWLQPSIWCSDLPLLSHSDQMLCYWISKAHGELFFRERRELPTWHPNLGGCCLPGNSYSKWTCTSRGEDNSIIIWSFNQQKFMVSVPWSGFCGSLGLARKHVVLYLMVKNLNILHSKFGYFHFIYTI